MHTLGIHSKRFRGIVEAGGDALPNFIEVTTDAAEAFAAGAKDLRSQVSKETCITLSRISYALSVKFEPIVRHSFSRACAR